MKNTVYVYKDKPKSIHDIANKKGKGISARRTDIETEPYSLQNGKTPL